MANLVQYMQRVGAIGDPAIIFVVILVGGEKLVGRITDIEADGFAVTDKQGTVDWVNPDHVLTIRRSVVNK